MNSNLLFGQENNHSFLTSKPKYQLDNSPPGNTYKNRFSKLRAIVIIAIFAFGYSNIFAQAKSVPYSESFDTFPIDNVTFGPGAEPNVFPNGWTNVQSDTANQDWYGRSTGTGSGNTGPSSDHTSGTGKYVFVEDGWGNNTDVTLESPWINLYGLSGVELSYWAHSWSGSTGALNKMHVDVYSSGSWVLNVDLFSKLATDAWYQRTVDLTPYSGDSIKIRFRGDNSATSFQHDIAIDDFSIYTTAITASIESYAHLICNNDSSGFITASTTFGTPPFIFSWSNGGTTDSIGGINAGLYSVLITDSVGDTSSASITLHEPSVIIPSFSVTDATCFGETNGSITLDAVSGGMPVTTECAIEVNSTLTGTASVDSLGYDTLVNTSTTYPAVYGNWYWGSKHQLLYTAAELNAIGITGKQRINSLAFDVEGIVGTATYQNLRIALGCTSDTSFSSTWQSGLLDVYNASTYTIDTGWNVHAFDTGYVWDGVSNLIVEFCFNNGGFTNNSLVKYTSTPFQSVRYYRGDISTVCSSTSLTGVSSNRPNTKFGHQSVSTSAYGISWGNGSTSLMIDSLSQGSYITTITDATGCAYQFTNTVDQPALLTASLNTSDVSCFNASDGTVSANASGGNSASSGNIVISEVSLGSPDFVEIVNTSSQAVDVSGMRVVLSNSYTDISLSNSTTWNLSGTMAAGAIDYRSDATGSNYWGNNIFYSNGSSSWAILIDSTGNILDAVFWGYDTTSINNFSTTVGSLVVTNNGAWAGQGSNASCGNSISRIGSNDNNNGSDWSCATITMGTTNSGLSIPFTGQYSYTYVWSTGDTSSTISNLGPGLYSVTISDNNGCMVIDTAIISEPVILNANASVDSTISCFGFDNGIASAMPSGGTAPYSFIWSTGDTSSTISNLAPGSYYIHVTDSNGCVDSDTLYMTEPTMLATSVSSITGTTCISATDGSATVSSSGGTGSHVYMWSDGSSNAVNSGIGVGNYTVTIADANGCSDTLMVAISNSDSVAPTVITQSITVYLDTTGMASITAMQVDNGSFDNCQIQSYSIDSSTFDCTTLGSQIVTLTVMDSSNNSASATATIMVMDTLKPTLISQSYSAYLDTNGMVTISVNDVDAGSMDNCSISNLWLSGNTFTCSSVAPYSVMLHATDASGNEDSVSVSITVMDTLVPTVNANNSSIYLDSMGMATLAFTDISATYADNCNVDTMYMSNSSFTCNDLGLHNITFTAVDPSLNMSSITVQVTVMDTLFPSFTSLMDTAYCGTSIMYDMPTAWDNCSAPQMLQVGGPAMGSTQLPGTYYIVYQLQDSASNMLTDSLMVTLYSIPAVDLGADTTICINWQIDLSAPAGHSYLWSDGTMIQTNSILANTLTAGMHTIGVTVTSVDGCVSTDDILVIIDACTGIDKNDIHTETVLYPNPNKGVFTIEVNSNTEQTVLFELLNFNGKLVWKQSKTLTNQKELIKVQQGHLAKGIYFLKMTSATESKYNKVIIQ